jgi:hypothetical protein
MIDDGVLEHVDVESDFEGPSTHRGHLPEHDILCDAMAVILLSNGSRFHQNFDCLLE